MDQQVGKLLFLINLFISLSLSQDIVFENNEELSHLSGNKPAITDRIPLYIPKKCPENMLLYPGGGNRSSWICDCRPRFLYFPLSHSCHEAFRQGPCPPGQFVVLLNGEVVPTCVNNPCLHDGVVPFKNTCYSLRTKGGPCAPDVIGVNETTFSLECISTDTAPFIVIDTPKYPCPPGSRRNSLGICKKTL